MKIILPGIPPSKKNSKRILKNRRTGKRFIASSESHQAWHDLAAYQILQELRRRVYAIPKWENRPVALLTITFYPPDKRRHDSTNVAESINDLLVDMHIIPDDSWFHLPDIRLKLGGIDKKNPRVEIEITESTEGN